VKNKLPVGAGSPKGASCSDNDSEFRGFEEVIEGCKNLEQRLFLNLGVEIERKNIILGPVR